ncbi:MAG TPA: nuclease-related domain-containing protein [Candidatus Limnocylindria bacterium]|nr:nuclease-related domain-containing protein [Candidatus Limnocylindria bacterium]
MTTPLQWARAAVTRADPRSRLAEDVALHLRANLPDDHIVLARHAPRDGGVRVPVVVIGRRGLVVIEPREDAGDLVCYQDHWYRRVDGALAHPIADPPSLRARANAGRLRRDLGSGGYINVPIEALVLLTRGRPDDVRSSCVPVIAGLDALVGHLRIETSSPADPAHAHALHAALVENIKLTLS